MALYILEQDEFPNGEDDMFVRCRTVGQEVTLHMRTDDVDQVGGTSGTQNGVEIEDLVRGRTVGQEVPLHMRTGDVDHVGGTSGGKDRGPTNAEDRDDSPQGAQPMGHMAWGWDDNDDYEEVRHRGAQGAFPLLWGSSISKISNILLTVMIGWLVIVTSGQMGELSLESL